MTERRTNIEVWDSISLDLICIQVGGRIEYINSAGAKMLGAVTSEQLVGRPILDFVHPDYREIALERDRQLTMEGIIVCPNDEKWLRLDGTAIDVEVAAMPIHYQGKLAVQFIVREGDECKSNRSARNWHYAPRSWRKRR